MLYTSIISSFKINTFTRNADVKVSDAVEMVHLSVESEMRASSAPPPSHISPPISPLEEASLQISPLPSAAETCILVEEPENT